MGIIQFNIQHITKVEINVTYKNKIPDKSALLFLVIIIIFSEISNSHFTTNNTFMF